MSVRSEIKVITQDPLLVSGGPNQFSSCCCLNSVHWYSRIHIRHNHSYPNQTHRKVVWTTFLKLRTLIVRRGKEFAAGCGLVGGENHSLNWHWSFTTFFVWYKEDGQIKFRIKPPTCFKDNLAGFKLILFWNYKLVYRLISWPPSYML